LCIADVGQETIYAPRQGNDRLLLGLKGSLNEYELDLLRQRSLSARYAKARRGELIVSAPVGFVKAGDRVEKDPDRRVQEAISLVFDKVLAAHGRPYSGSTSMISISRLRAKMVRWLGDARTTPRSTE
jgi:DNA invertase Pin-like site-specific DNA recombinase